MHLHRWGFLIKICGGCSRLLESPAADDMLLAISGRFVGSWHRCDSQSSFIIFQGQKEHEDEQIIKAQDFIEKNFQERITVDQLASLLLLGRHNLERRFKKATSNTVVEYIQRVKVEAAKKSLETGRKNIAEVMYDVGYNDTKAFREIFKKTTGMTPVEYRDKYRKEVVI